MGWDGRGKLIVVEDDESKWDGYIWVFQYIYIWLSVFMYANIRFVQLRTTTGIIQLNYCC